MRTLWGRLIGLGLAFAPRARYGIPETRSREGQWQRIQATVSFPAGWPGNFLYWAGHKSSRKRDGVSVNELRKRQTELVQVLAAEQSSQKLAEASAELERVSRALEEHQRAERRQA